MMRSLYFFIFISLSIFLSSGCLKDVPSPAETDQKSILEYITRNNLNTTEHPSGIHYIIEEPGTGEHPEPEATVEVKYKGSLTDGFVFDQSKEGETVSFKLNELIPGWQIAIPLLKPGGKGLFIIPSTLGYGSSSVGPIPPNSVLVFEIELVSFQ